MLNLADGSILISQSQRHRQPERITTANSSAHYMYSKSERRFTIGRHTRLAEEHLGPGRIIRLLGLGASGAKARMRLPTVDDDPDVRPEGFNVAPLILQLHHFLRI